MKKKLFSLVELALGVAILAIGSTAVVTLIPVGIKENKEAIGKNYVALTLQDIQTFVKQNAESSKANFETLLNSLPAEEPSSNVNYSTVKWETGAQKDKSGIYSTNNSGIYVIKIYSGNNLDFEAQLNIWKSTPDNAISASEGVGGLPFYKQDQVSVDSQAQSLDIPGITTLVTTNTPATTATIAGGISKINPSGSANNEFVMIYVKPDGTLGTMEFKGTGLVAGTYNVKSLHIRIQGASSTVTLDGADVADLKNGKVFDIISGATPFKVTLSGSKNKWTISGLSGTVVTGGGGTKTEQVITGGVYVPGVSGGETDGVSKISGINVELSWPIGKPYKERAKHKHYFEIYQPAN